MKNNTVVEKHRMLYMANKHFYEASLCTVLTVTFSCYCILFKRKGCIQKINHGTMHLS